MPAKIFQLFQDEQPLHTVSTREVCRILVAEFRRKRQPQVNVGSPLWATEADRRDGMTMRDITPPLLDSAERAAGDSLNARLHRLIGGDVRHER